ncbi:hypothetical protein [Kitasatospora sp. NPDC057541]|uniref:hypothetical protein n=1 Tax=unclassified Kitasatospora TaxID=2633591 RepID=UPI0036A9112E
MTAASIPRVPRWPPARRLYDVVHTLAWRWTYYRDPAAVLGRVEEEAACLARGTTSRRPPASRLVCQYCHPLSNYPMESQ